MPPALQSSPGPATGPGRPQDVPFLHVHVAHGVGVVQGRPSHQQRVVAASHPQRGRHRWGWGQAVQTGQAPANASYNLRVVDAEEHCA